MAKSVHTLETAHCEGAARRTGNLIDIAEILSYDPETGAFRWLTDRGRSAKAGDLAGQAHPSGYRQIRVFGTLYLAHRLAWAMATGSWPVHHIDHINGDKQDNRLSNLREATNAENSRNGALRPSNTTGFKGVSFVAATGRYRATITVDYRQKFLGTYATAEEAHAAYVAAAAKHHGEFSRVA